MTKARSNASSPNALGDLVVGTGTGTASVLPVSTSSGDTIVADSSATTGLRYSATPSASNPILNSSFQNWQRGTTSTTITTATKTYGPDRWYYALSGTGSMYVTRQATSDSTNLPFIQYCARVQRTAANANTATLLFQQPLESINSVPFAGKTVTFSFYARAGANYSATSNGLTAYLITGTGTDESQFGGYTGQATPITNVVSLTTTWQRFTASGTLSSTTNEFCLSFAYVPTGTAGANDYFEVTGVQVDIGSVALPFRTYAATIQGELAACQRYYYTHVSGPQDGNYLPIANGWYQSATQLGVVIKFPVNMRVIPTVDVVTGTNYYQNATGDVFNSFTLDNGGKTAVALYNNTQAAGTAGQANYLQTANAAAYLGFSAEL